MAKSKKKKAILPKRIAGVKVPKTLRRGRAAKFLSSPVGIALLSDALVTAGAMLTKKEARPGSATRQFADHPLASLADLGAGAKLKGEHSAEALRGAFTAASVAFADALRNSADAVEATAGKKSPARTEPRAAH
jgi:hypothetical protein